jgi:hypothetical protein
LTIGPQVTNLPYNLHRWLGGIFFGFQRALPVAESCGGKRQHEAEGSASGHTYHDASGSIVDRGLSVAIVERG